MRTKADRLAGIPSVKERERIERAVHASIRRTIGVGNKTPLRIVPKLTTKDGWPLAWLYAPEKGCRYRVLTVAQHMADEIALNMPISVVL